METRYDRLLQLADHLEKGKLIHREFNFYYFNFGEEDETGCGTAGCAIGECPAIFPEWKFDYSFPVFNEATLPDPFVSAREFFCLDRLETYHLFHPGCQRPLKYGGKELRGFATKEQVAANIRAFVAHKQSLHTRGDKK